MGTTGFLRSGTVWGSIIAMVPALDLLAQLVTDALPHIHDPKVAAAISGVGALIAILRRLRPGIKPISGIL